MKIALLSHFFPPEPCAAAHRVSTMRDALHAAGHEVTVFTTFPSFPEGRFTTAVSFPHARERDERGEIVRVWSCLPPFARGRRLVHWLSSSLSLAAHATFTRAPFDAVIVSMPPITLALPALAAAARHRARLVVDVRDVFPDIAIAMGAWDERSFVARACEFVARTLYRRADLTIAVTPTALGQIRARGIEDARLFLAPNAAAHDGVTGVQPRDDRAFVATYAGNLGVATDVDVLVDAAALLAQDDITIEIVGDGSERERMASRIRDERIGNLRLRGPMPRPAALAALAASGVALVPLRSGINESVPTKLYDAVSVAVPVIVAASGEARREADELGAISVPPGNARALADAVRELRSMDPAMRRTLGERACAQLRQRADRAGIMAGVAARVSALA